MKTTRTTTRIGLVGCGHISDDYLKTNASAHCYDIVACADIVEERAREKAEQYHVPKVCGIEELIRNPEIDLVLNLTPPQAHVEIGLRAIEAGKSLYTEKPLAAMRNDARRLLEAAEAKGVAVGCAPDSFLGRGMQTCRCVIEDGMIGIPAAAVVYVTSHGHESWHPDPAYYYQPGAGPLLDIGVYYLTALTALLGPVHQVNGMTQTALQERLITSQPRQGETIAVNTPTHVTGTVRFANAVVATVTASFDVWGPRNSIFEIYGTEGTLRLPNPVKYEGPVSVWCHDDSAWQDIPLIQTPQTSVLNARGIGLLDMAEALQTGRKHQAGGELAYHVLDMMCSFYEAAEQQSTIKLEDKDAL